VAEYLASRGMVAITANYSMHPKNGKGKMALPEGESKKRICVMDGKSVIRWVKQHADELGVAANRIVAGGASAGGHIAVLSMLDNEYNNPKDPEGVNTDVKAFLLFCPAFTLLEKDIAPDVNVFDHLDQPIPPALFLVGETDLWKKASDALVEVLFQKGCPVENWMAPGVGHMFFRKEPWLNSSLKKVDEFLVSHGLMEGKSPLVHPAGGEKLVESKGYLE
jgi:acetyl esterase